MSRLADIGVRIEGPHPFNQGGGPGGGPGGGLGGGVTALLAELAALLDRVAAGDAAATDQSAMIDLRSLPLSPEDRARLKQILGEGEVQATLQALGTSTLRETRVAGVWWVEHRDDHGELVAELLEVSAVPRILARAPDEMAAAAAGLRAGVAS